METANYNARRAVNALLDQTGSTQPRVNAIEPYSPPEWEPLRQVDAARYRQGQANLFDSTVIPSSAILNNASNPAFSRGIRDVRELAARLTVSG
jgi:hypothetical protein